MKIINPLLYNIRKRLREIRSYLIRNNDADIEICLNCLLKDKFFKPNNSLEKCNKKKHIILSNLPYEQDDIQPVINFITYLLKYEIK